MTELSVWVPGIPQPQGSTRAFPGRGKAAGKVIVTSDNAGLKSWRQMVTWQAHLVRDGQAPIAGGVKVAIEFWFPRPASHHSKAAGATALDVLPSAPRDHLVKPDLDKLVRAILDGLTEAGVFRDDSQVVALITRKSYTTVNPGAAITVRQASTSTSQQQPQEVFDGERHTVLHRVVG